MAGAAYGHGVFLSIVALSLFGCSQPAVSLENNLPKSAPLSIRHDFGVVRPSSKHEHTFTLANTSEEVWTFAAIENSCTCMVSIPETEQIPPGGSGRITVTYNAKGVTRDDKTTVEVRFWESSAPFWELTVTAKVREPMTVRPDSLMLEVDPGTSRDEVFEITNFSETSWDAPNIVSSHSWLTTQVSELPLSDPQIEGDARQAWRVALNASPPSSVNGHVTVNLLTLVGQEEYSRNIPVEVRVRQPVVLIPSELFFGRVAASSECSREAVIRFRREVDDAQLSLKRITHTLGDLLDCELRRRNSRECVLSVTLRSEDQSGLLEGQIYIDFPKLEISTIRIPVRALLEL
ncbi:MAG: DUF1573 domain-containing protein [Planctomycetales bacterium]|nr:DUF1573 domain-containing protein [Planctomycetales bacterium]MCA9142630.1 DUF1573 domain-containing protein [Planctomycetales bacterium]